MRKEINGKKENKRREKRGSHMHYSMTHPNLFLCLEWGEIGDSIRLFLQSAACFLTVACISIDSADCLCHSCWLCRLVEFSCFHSLSVSRIFFSFFLLPRRGTKTLNMLDKYFYEGVYLFFYGLVIDKDASRGCL